MADNSGALWPVGTRIEADGEGSHIGGWLGVGIHGPFGIDNGSHMLFDFVKAHSLELGVLASDPAVVSAVHGLYVLRDVEFLSHLVHLVEALFFAEVEGGAGLLDIIKV